MGTYVIKELYQSNEDGYVYADVLINDESEPRRLIIPESIEEAKIILENYLNAEENLPIPVLPQVDVEVSALIDQIQEV